MTARIKLNIIICTREIVLLSPSFVPSLSSLRLFVARTLLPIPFVFIRFWKDIYLLVSKTQLSLSLDRIDTEHTFASRDDPSATSKKSSR